jgi:hypothetical protein
MTLKTNLNQSPLTPGLNNPDIRRPAVALGSPALRDVGSVTDEGVLDYHAFLFKGMKRFSNGFSMLLSYTFGQAKDIASDNDGSVTLTNIVDPMYDYGVASYNVTHTGVASFIYELPWGRNHALGGWQVNGIGYWRSGIPVNITQTGVMGSTGNGSGLAQANRPNLVGNLVPADQTIDRWFDAAALQRPADTTATYGDIERNYGRGPGIFNVDLSLVKNTKIGPIDTELRIEAFNVFNHPQFGQPNGTLGNAAFGTITASANPQCGTCGTSERQIQFGLKLRF